MFVKTIHKNTAKAAILILVLISILMAYDIGNAESTIELSESELIFRGLVGETLQRTVTLTVHGDPIFDSQYVYALFITRWTVL